MEVLHVIVEPYPKKWHKFLTKIKKKNYNNGYSDRIDVCLIGGTFTLTTDRSGGMPGARPPYGTQFFCFRIHFCRKVPASGPMLPPHGSTPRLWEILDPPLLTYIIYVYYVKYETRL